jgi:DNA-binding MarR family transcriptional regulator
MGETMSDRDASDRESASGAKVAGRTHEGATINDLFLLLFRLNGRLGRAGDSLAREVGLTAARWQVLGAVASAPKPVAHIAREFGLSRQGVLSVVQSMISNGMVELIDNPNHRRAKLVVQTPKGRAAYDVVTARQKVWVNRLGTSFNLATLNITHETLHELYRQLVRDDPASDKD